MFHKKATLKHFVIFSQKHLYRGLFFNKVAGHQACNIIKKRLQHKHFLANIKKLIGRPILKNISERVPCRKVFFRSDLNLAKGTIDDLLCERLLKVAY